MTKFIFANAVLWSHFVILIKQDFGETSWLLKQTVIHFSLPLKNNFLWVWGSPSFSFFWEPLIHWEFCWGRETPPEISFLLELWKRFRRRGMTRGFKAKGQTHHTTNKLRHTITPAARAKSTTLLNLTTTGRQSLIGKKGKCLFTLSKL